MRTCPLCVQFGGFIRERRHEPGRSWFVMVSCKHGGAVGTDLNAAGEIAAAAPNVDEKTELLRDWKTAAAGDRTE